MTDRELMQQALEALEQVADYFNADSTEAKTITALRERLAQPEQEADAYLFYAPDMEREQIIRMAREAGLSITTAYGEKPALERFAELVAAAEREALANINWTPILREGGLVTWGDAATLADLVFTTIRARGQA